MRRKGLSPFLNVSEITKDKEDPTKFDI